jgi:hypothetical protein
VSDFVFDGTNIDTLSSYHVAISIVIFPIMAPRKAYVTLLTNASYLNGTLVLDSSLRRVGSKYPLVVMVTPRLGKPTKDHLAMKGIQIVEVDMLQPNEGVHDLAAHDARFKDTWTKLR